MALDLVTGGLDFLQLLLLLLLGLLIHSPLLHVLEEAAHLGVGLVLTGGRLVALGLPLHMLGLILGGDPLLLLQLFK